jgi:hypothetical protein
MTLTMSESTANVGISKETPSMKSFLFSADFWGIFCPRNKKF